MQSFVDTRFGFDLGAGLGRDPFNDMRQLFACTDRPVRHSGFRT